MPIVGFSILGIGGILIYSGYLGYSPVTVVKAFIDNTTSQLVRVPIDPRKRAAQVTPKNPSDGSIQAPGQNPLNPYGTQYDIYNPQQQTQGNVLEA